MFYNKLNLAILCIGMATLASCSQDNENKVTSNDSRKIVLTSTVGMTRSLNQNIQASQLANGNTVGVFITDEGTEVLSDNTKITADGEGGFIYSRDLYWPVEGKASIFTYGPYQDDWAGELGEDVEFTVEKDQSTDEGYLKSDLVFGLPKAGNPLEQTSASVPLAFSHKLAKVNITVTNDTETSLADATVTLKDMPTTVTMNTKTGELGKTSGSDTIRVATFAGTATSYKCSAIVIPQKLTYGSQVVKVRLKNGKTMAATTRTDMELQSGKTYNFNINVTVGGADLNVSISSLANWDSNTSDLAADIDTETAEDFDNPTDDTGEVVELKATFETPASNATYTAPTYEWTGSTSNLMTIFKFSNGELAKYSTLTFKISNLSASASVRVNFAYGSGSSDNMTIGTDGKDKTFGKDGEKTITMETVKTALAGVDKTLADVTAIRFGGSSGSGSVDIKADEVILKGTSSSSGGNTLTATFGTPASNASYAAPTYTWTAGNSNLMTVFEFANGELKNYSKLTFKFSNLSSGSAIRMGYYVGNNWTAFNDGNGYYSNGTKTVDLTTLGIDLSTVTKICFGGFTSSGSCDIKASDVILSK